MENVQFWASNGSRTQWPNGKPVASEPLPDGRVRYQLESGRLLTVGQPTYRVDYVSTWVGTEPGETYAIRLALIGLSNVDGFYEAWNFDIGEVRNYRFDKTVLVTHLETGETFNTVEFEDAVRAAVAERDAGNSP